MSATNIQIFLMALDFDASWRLFRYRWLIFQKHHSTAYRPLNRTSPPGRCTVPYARPVYALRRWALLALWARDTGGDYPGIVARAHGQSTRRALT
jgi:hypothetical protein